MIRHLIDTDVRRFRWILGAWALLMVANAALVFLTPHSVDEPGRYAHLTVAIVLLYLVTHLAPLVFVPLVVQADAPVGSDVFWVTRPIPPHALLAAKTIVLLGTLVILPALLELAAMIGAHVASREIALVALDTVLAAIAWLTVLMAASAVTPTYAKFALLCASTVVATAVNVVVAVAILRSRVEDSFAMISVGPVPVPESPDGTAGIVFLLGLILSGCVLLILQYQRRQRAVSIPAGLAGLALAFLAAAWWPWPLLRAHTVLPGWSAGVRLTAASTAAPFDPPSQWSERPTVSRLGRLSLRIGGVAPGWFASVTMRDAGVTLPDGSLVKSRRGGFPAWPSFEETDEAPQRVTLRQLLSVNRLADRMPQRGENSAAMVVSPDDYRRLESVPAAYRGTFVIEFTRAEIVGTLPLAEGAVFDGGVYRLELGGVRFALLNNVAINAIQTRATSTFDRGPRETYTVYAVNADRSDAAEALIHAPVEDSFAGFGGTLSVGVGIGFLRQGVVLSLSPRQGSNPVEMTIDGEWLKHARLVVVRTTTAGRLERTVDVPGLRVCTSPNGQCKPSSATPP